MDNLTINGRELAIEFEHASQGFRLTAMEYDGDEWQTIPNYDGVLCLMMTQFEALANLSSDLFDEAVHAETMAQLLEIPMITSDEDWQECPNHGGAYDCTPFCLVCEGNQEFDAAVPLPCTECDTPVDALTYSEELGFCVPCQHAYFTEPAN